MSITTSRRSFVKGAGAGIAAVAATSMISGVAFADDAKASEVKDGTYTAAARGKHADVNVEVTVEGGKVTDIKIGDNIEMPGMVESVEKIMLPLIINNQTLNVDTVTGSTITSMAVLNAVTDACKQAGLEASMSAADHAAPVYEAPATTDADVIILLSLIHI